MYSTRSCYVPTLKGETHLMVQVAASILGISFFTSLWISQVVSPHPLAKPDARPLRAKTWTLWPNLAAECVWPTPINSN